MSHPLFLDIETCPQVRFLDPAVALDVGKMWRDLEGLQQRCWAAGFLDATGKLIGRPGEDVGVQLPSDLPADLRETIESDDLADAFPYYIDWLRETAQAPLAITGCAPALSPITAHVVSVAFGWYEGKERKVDIWTLKGFGLDCVSDDNFADVAAAEMLLLIESLSRIGSASLKDGTVLVSFNGKAFDAPFLRARGALLNVKPEPMPRWVKPKWAKYQDKDGILHPYDVEAHTDLRLLLASGDRYARGTLKTWADAFGVPSMEAGAEVWPWVREGKWEKLHEYGVAEMGTLFDLWERVKGWA